MLRAALMTIAEVAALLKVTARTVGGWIRSGDLRAVKAGKDWRIAQVDLEAFLNAHANRPQRPGEESLRPAAAKPEAPAKPDNKVVGLEAWRSDKQVPKAAGEPGSGSRG
jgi:excisionase family DNA binding protein